MQKPVATHARDHFQVLKPIHDFSGPDSGPGSCVLWNVLYNLIQPIFPVLVPVPCSGPGVSQCEYTISQLFLPVMQAIIVHNEVCFERFPGSAEASRHHEPVLPPVTTPTSL